MSDALTRRNQLVLEHQNLIWFAWHKWKHTRAFRRLGAEDAFSAGQLGLIEAATRYNESVGKFSTYALHWIRATIQEESSDSSTVTIPRNVINGEGTPEMLEKARMATRSISIFDDEGRRRIDTAIQPARPLWDLDGWEELQDALRFIHPVYREKILGYYRDGMILEEVADRDGITKERARQLIMYGIRKLCKRLGIKNIPTPRTHLKGKCCQKVRPPAHVEE